MKIVLDTNVLVASTLTPHGSPARLIALWRRAAFEIVLTDEILAEYLRALSYEKIRARQILSPTQVSELLAAIDEGRSKVPATGLAAQRSRDTDDDKFLACAEAGEANYIVTGDKDLLSLKEYEGIQIVTPAEFLHILEEGVLQTESKKPPTN
jgi:uncharacterized protein